MKLNMAPLVLFLPLLMSACDSQQPSYSASNANSAPPPPQAPAQAPPPAPPVAVAAEKRPDIASPRPAEPVKQEFVSPYPVAKRPPPLPPVAALGIGGCDDFIDRYRACVNNGVADGSIPVDRRSSLVRGLNVRVRQWQADVAAGKTSELVAECAEADKKARPELVSVGCTSF